MVEGESPYALAAGARGTEDEAEDSDDSAGSEPGTAPGTVYRLAKGQLRRLDGGMEQYEEIATRSAAKLGRGKR